MSHPIDIQNAIALLSAEGYEIKYARIEVEVTEAPLTDMALLVKFKRTVAPKEKFPEIKEAIERVLNNKVYTAYLDLDVKYDSSRIHEMNGAMEKAFNAGREITLNMYSNQWYRYPSYQDYKNSLQSK
jgi:hypothetical protein